MSKEHPLTMVDWNWVMLIHWRSMTGNHEYTYSVSIKLTLKNATKFLIIKKSSSALRHIFHGEKTNKINNTVISVNFILTTISYHTELPHSTWAAVGDSCRAVWVWWASSSSWLAGRYWPCSVRPHSASGTPTSSFTCTARE